MTIYSASALKRWMGCPKQEHFRRTLKRDEPENSKTVFGSCIHEALKYYNDTGDEEGTLEKFKRIWKNPSIIDSNVDKWLPGTTYAGLLNKGLEVLKSQFNRTKWVKSSILASEYAFCVPFGDHELHGYIDRIDAVPVGGRFDLKIIDYKTGKKPWKPELLMDVQFTTYDYASQQPEFWMGYTDSKGREWEGFSNGKELYELFDGRRRELIWFDLINNKQIDVGDRDEADYGRLYRVCTEVQSALDAGIYVPNISGDTCRFCQYTDVCPVVAPVREKLVAIGEIDGD